VVLLYRIKITNGKGGGLDCRAKKARRIPPQQDANALKTHLIGSLHRICTFKFLSVPSDS
jgi:hypothetical protein